MDNHLKERLEKVFANIFHEAPQGSFDQMTRLNTERWDSLGHINLIVSLEEEFGVSISTEEAADITSFKSTAALLDEKIRGANG